MWLARLGVALGNQPLARLEADMLPAGMEQLGFADQREKNDVQDQLELPPDIGAVESLQVAPDFIG